MKKLLSFLLIFTMLISAAVISVSAAADVQYSIQGGEGKPGDTVEVLVNLDVNTGIWSAQFDVNYDARALKLLSVENGGVFRDGEVEKGNIDDSGVFRFIAMLNDVESNNTNTGCMLKLKFKILDSAPNGEQKISLSFIDNGEGWYIDVNDTSRLLTVICPKDGAIKVKDSNADPLPDTEAPKETDKPDSSTQSTGDKETEKQEALTSIVVEVVTDEKGDAVIGEDGKPVTTEKTIVVYDPAENNKGTSGEGSEKAPTDSTSAGDGKNTENSTSTVILIVCIAAATVAAVVIAVILVSRKKNSGNSDK